MSLKEQIEADLKKAMLAKNKDDMRALRGIKSLILLAETEKGASSGLDEAAELKILTKAAKQRSDSAALYQAEGREDLAQAELIELEIIKRYLPEQLDEGQLKTALELLIKELGASGPKDMGKVMGVATKKFAGKTDGKTISKIVKELLAG